MIHQPAPIDGGVEPFAVALAERGRSGALAVYAGAGLSRADPAAIPTGLVIAQRLVNRLSGAFSSLEGVDATDLPSVADAIADLPGGEDALLQTTVRVAEFTTATPTYAHRVLALLLLEGLIDVLTTNWDNCIERGYELERVSAVVTARDLASLSGPSVLKIHGCATQPESLLITSAHLASPSSWVVEQTRARLGAATVVFVGIGDIAGYVKTRISEALEDIDSVANIRVVSPSIEEQWSSSQWAQLTPDLADEHRIAMTADAFLEQLARGYVRAVVGDVAAGLESDAALSPLFAITVAAVYKHDALTVLSWIRQSAVAPAQGKSVLGSTPVAAVLCALGRIAPDGFNIRDRALALPDGQIIEVLVASGVQPTARLEREARNRLQKALSLGQKAPKFLLSGGLGARSTGGLPQDILSTGETVDILDGPIHGVPEILVAEEVLVS